jgi:hypothetical protein
MNNLLSMISGTSGNPIAVDRRPALNDRLQEAFNTEERNDRNRLHPSP